MKKFFVALTLIFLISSVSFGAASNDTSDYVKKEVFEARMDRMEALLEKTVMEIKVENEKLKVENEKFKNEMRSDIQRLDSKIQSLAADVKVLDNRITELDNKLSTRITELDSRLSTRISELDNRLTTTSNIVYWIFAISSVILAVLALKPITDGLRKPQITLEDVERLIDSKLSNQVQV